MSPSTRDWFNKTGPPQSGPWGQRKVFEKVPQSTTADPSGLFCRWQPQPVGTVTSLTPRWISVNVCCWRSTVCAEVDKCRLIFIYFFPLQIILMRCPAVRSCGGLWKNSQHSSLFLIGLFKMARNMWHPEHVWLLPVRRIHFCASLWGFSFLIFKVSHVPRVCALAVRGSKSRWCFLCVHFISAPLQGKLSSQARVIWLQFDWLIHWYA